MVDSSGSFRYDPFHFPLLFSVRRIWSRRLRTTGNSTTFLHSMDVKLSAIFAIKRLVLAAVKGESDDEIHKMMSVTNELRERSSTKQSD